jgi:hypothetical protein
MLLSQTAPLGHSLAAAAAAVAGLQSLQLHRRMPQLSRDLTTSTQQQTTGKSVGAADELLSQIKDKELLRTCGLIGGKWSEASNGATYDVSYSNSRATKHHLQEMLLVLACGTCSSSAGRVAVES